MPKTGFLHSGLGDSQVVEDHSKVAKKHFRMIELGHFLKISRSNGFDVADFGRS